MKAAKALKKTKARTSAPRRVTPLRSVRISEKPASQNEGSQHVRHFCDLTSHELSCVLGALVGELDYGTTHARGAERDHVMVTSLRAAERALALARNLRYFAAHPQVKREVTDIAQLLLDAVDLFEAELEARQIHINVFAESALYAQVDPGGIQQVILNLLSHAMVSMPLGGKVSLSLRQVKRQLEIRCGDSGVGLPSTEVASLFSPPFTHAGAHVQRMGLAVSKVLIEAHQGSIDVASAPGQGTEFIVRLPYDPQGPTPGPFPEKRRYRRVDLKLAADLVLPGDGIIQTELSNLGLGGGFALIPRPEALHRIVKAGSLTVRIAYYRDQVLEIQQARVANAQREGNATGVGLQFAELDAKARKILAAIVKSHST